MSEIEEIYDGLWQKCGEDGKKFMSHFAAFAVKKANYFDEDLLANVRKYIERASPIAEKRNLEVGTADISLDETVNDERPLKGEDGDDFCVPATQYALDATLEKTMDESNQGDPQILNDETKTDAIDGESKEDEYDDDIIPETQYTPSRTSSRNSIASDAEEAEEDIDLAANKNSVRESGRVDESEFIHVDQDTNSNWPEAANSVVNASQAVFHDVDSELLADIDVNGKTNDLPTTIFGNAGKSEADVLDEFAEKSDENEKSAANTTGESSKQLDPNTTAASFSTCRENDRSDSVTPDLDMFSTPMVPSGAAGTIDVPRVTGVVDFVNETFDDRSQTPDLLIDESRASPTDEDAVTTDEQNALAAAANEDSNSSESNDNELFGACTQVFPPPAKLNYSKPVSTVEMDGGKNVDAEDDSADAADKDAAPEEIATDDTATVTVTDTAAGAAADQDKDDDIYAAATQMYPHQIEATHMTSPPKRLSNSSKEKSSDAPKNAEMGPPVSLPSASRRSLPRKPDEVAGLSSNPAADDPFDACTQVFLPLPTTSANSNDDAATAVSDAGDDVNRSEIAMQTSNKRLTVDGDLEDSESIWPSNTPKKSVAAMIPVADIEKYWVSPKKRKIQAKQRWLFNDSSDEDDSPVPLLSPKQKAMTTKQTAITSAEKQKKSNESVASSAKSKSDAKSDRRSKRNGIESAETKSALKRKAAKSDLYVSEAEDQPRLAIIPTSSEMAQMKKRRVSVVLARMRMDLNSNLPTPHKSHKAALISPETDQKVARNEPKPHKQAKSPNSDGRRAREDAAPPKSVSDVTNLTPNRRGRPTKRSNTGIDSPAPVAPKRNVVEKSRSDVSMAKMAVPRDAIGMDSRSRSRSKNRVEVPSVAQAHRIMFTKVDLGDRSLKQAVTNVPRLGGKIVDCATDCTVLVCERLFRTNKMLCSVNRGVPIVTPQWLIDSHKRGKFVTCDPYLVKDATTEARYDFNLKQSLELAAMTPLFKNYYIFTTPNTIPPPSEIAMIVECGGGKCSSDHSKSIAVKVQKFVVSSTADANMWRKYRALHPKIPIINAEGFMRIVMQQRIEFDGYRLK